MKKIILSIITILTAFTLAVAPVYAEDCVLTSILGNEKCKEEGGKITKDPSGTLNCSCDEEGSSVNDTLNTIIDIMTIGVGILGVIGISITGVQYLTAGGNEEQTRKAKRRMFEIIIGLVAYVLIYALVKWLGVQPS